MPVAKPEPYGEEELPPRRTPLEWEQGVPGPEPYVPPDITLGTLDPNAAIGNVERNSAGILPTRVVLDLAGLDIADRDKAIAARRMARTWDLLPQVVFGDGDPAKILSRATGEPVSMRDALRFTNRFAPVALASMLDSMLGDGHFIKGKDLEPVAPVDALRVAAFANAIGRSADVDLAMGLSVAVQIAAKESFSAKTFEANYEMARRWAATGQTPVGVDALLQLAIAASRKGKAPDIAAIAKIAAPEAVKATRKQEAFYRAEAAELGVTYEDYLERLTPQAAASDAFVAQASEGAFPAVGGGIAQIGPDYWRDVTEMSARVRLMDEAFDRSIMGKVIGGAGAALQASWNFTQKGLGTLGAGIVTPVALTIAAIDPNSDVAGTWGNIQETHADLYRMIDEGRTVGDIVQEGWGYKLGVDIPDWTGLAFDFYVGWYIDPFALAGKGAQISRQGRMLVSADKSTVLRNLVSNVPVAGKALKARTASLAAARNAAVMRKINGIGDSRLSKMLFKRLDDETAYFREMDFAGRGAVANRTLDHTYMGLLRQNILHRYGSKGADKLWRLDPAKLEEARAAFADGMKAQFYGTGPVGSVAEETILMREAGSRLSASKAADAVADAAGKPQQLGLGLYDLDDVYLGIRAEDVAGFHFYTKELPNASALGVLGPRRLARRAMTTQRGTEFSLGQRISALPNINPGRKAPLFGDDAWSYRLAHARRWSTFSESEVQAYAQRARDILASGKATETNLMRLDDAINTEAIKRILAPYNLTDDAIEQVTDTAFASTRALNEREMAFGASKLKGKITEPLLETQLRNFTYVADPVHVRSILRDYTGAPRRMKAHLLSAIGKDAPEITAAINTLPHNAAVRTKDFAGNMVAGTRGLWKALTVARPAYIPRVILGDENLRFLTTTNSIFERLAAQQWWGLTKRLDDTGAFTRRFYAPDGTEIASVGLPGAMERNAAAVGQIRESEVIDAVMRQAKVGEDALRGGISWDILEATNPSHLDAWTWDLSKQFGNSTPGQVALRSVMDGDSIQVTQEKLLRWASDDHYRTLSSRIGIKQADAVDWSNDVAQLTHGYTLGKAEIAEAALSANAKDLRRVLDAIPMNLRPKVHGPTVDDLIRGRNASTIGRITDFNYRHWVRNPESRMNRHPFYKVQKRRAEEGMYELIEASGQKVDDLLRRRVDEASTEFALEQVNKVMFDLTKQSRFTELLQFAFPFPQPFFEGFQAWGHLVRRNPAIIARAQALYRLGKETGFIWNDPITGEDVITMAPVEGIAKVIAQGFGMDPQTFDDLGIKFVAPLSSLNMLTQTTMRFGPDGIVGKIAGGVEIPVPGLRPELAGFAQWAFRDSTNEAAVSYLFQYGPTVSYLPRSVSTALGVLGFPTGPDEATEERMVLTLLRAYQVQGIGFNPDGTPISEEELLAMARRDAHALSQARQISALFAPASPRIHTAATPMEALWQSYIEEEQAKDPKDYFTKALDRWGKEQPKLWMIPIGKTYYEGTFTDPRSGEVLRGPRLPASRITMEMLATPGIGDVMRRDKAWAGLLLLGVDSDLVEAQDFPTFARLLSDTSYRYKTPEESLEEGESRPAWKMISEFYETTWNPGLAFMDANSLDTQDHYYTDLRTQRQEFFAKLYNKFPMWVRANLDQQEGPGGEVIWDWAGERTDVPTELVLASARQLTGTPGMGHFPGVIALGRYLELRDDIRDRMVTKGYGSITQDNASDLAARFAKGVSKINADTPGFDQYLSQLLGVRIGDDGVLTASDDLQKVRSGVITAYDEIPEALRDAAVEFDTTMERLASRPYDADAPIARQQRFLKLSAHADAIYEATPEVVKAWWQGLGPSARVDFRDRLLAKPPEFYTRWDWHVMGYDVNAEAADAWRAISEQRMEIAQLNLEAEINQTEFSTSEAYAQLNADVAGYMKLNPDFARTVAKANDWAFPFVEGPDPLVEMHGKAGQAWKAITQATRALQGEVTKGELFGPGGFGNTDEQTAWYRWQQKELREYVTTLREWSPAFASSWSEVQSALGGDPIVGSVILPDDYYGPLGGVGYGD